MKPKISKIALIAVMVITIPLLIAQAQTGDESNSTESEGLTSSTTASATDNAGSETTEESEPSSSEGQILGESTQSSSSTASEVSSIDTTSASGTKSAGETDALNIGLASTSASTTEETIPVPPKEDKKPKLVLQPQIEMVKSGKRIDVNFKIENLSEDIKASPDSVPVSVYYTPWYPNDGPDNVEEVDSKKEKSEFSIQSMNAKDSSSVLSWSKDLPPGHYYLVVVVDPENKFDAYQMQRTEVIVE